MIRFTLHSCEFQIWMRVIGKYLVHCLNYCNCSGSTLQLFCSCIYVLVGFFSGRGIITANTGKISVDIPVTFASGKNTIDLLSLTIGLQVSPYFLLYSGSAVFVNECHALRSISDHGLFFVHQFFNQNYGAFFDKSGAGITGPVQLKGLKNGTTTDLSSQRWTYQVSLPILFCCNSLITWNFKNQKQKEKHPSSSIWISSGVPSKDEI